MLMTFPPIWFPGPATPSDDSFEVSQINDRKVTLLPFMGSYAYWHEAS